MPSESLKPKKGKKKPVKVLDATPTWMSLFNYFKGSIEDKAQNGMSDVNSWSQIERAFKSLDHFIAKQKDETINERVGVVYEKMEWELIKILIHNDLSLTARDLVYDEFGDKGLELLEKMQTQIPQYRAPKNGDKNG